MRGWFERSFFHLIKADTNYVQELAKMTATERERHYRDLVTLDQRRRELERTGLSFENLHIEVSPWTRRFMSGVREFECGARANAIEQIAKARDAEWKQLAFDHARAKLQKFLSATGLRPVRFYGGIKQESSLETKIDAFNGGHPCDLDDLIRFRAVLEGLSEMAMFCGYLRRTFDVTRCRNYYIRPRNGMNDPYRAVHFLIPGYDSSVIEVQVQSCLRDAVGMLDHSLVLKKSVGYVCAAQRQWLQSISFVANVLELERTGVGVASSPTAEGDFSCTSTVFDSYSRWRK